MKNMHYLDGKWVETKDLKISALDLSVMRGFGIFDFLRTYNHKPFLAKEHIDRMFNSAKNLGLTIDKSRKELEDIVSLGIKKNKKTFRDFNIRLIVTGGIGIDSVTPGRPSLIIIFGEAVDYPKEYFEKGIKVITYNAKRAFPSAKTINYLYGVLALQEAKNKHAVEALYVDNKKNIYEAITSNFFAIIDNKLVTPKEEILIGITRGAVIKLAKERKIKIVERAINLREIPKFQEAFITASNKEIMPVTFIDEKKVGNGKVGSITKELLNAYRILLD